MSQNVSRNDEREQQAALKNKFLSIAYQAEFSRRDALKGLFGVAAAAVLFGGPARALAEPQASQETLDALSEAQEEYNAVQSQLDSISAQFQELSIQQSDTLQQIEDVQTQIDDTQAQIEQKQEELEEKQSGLAERVASSYKSGDGGALALLLSSTSFDELISNAYYLDKVNESDQQAIEEVQEIQEELAAQKQELEEQKSDLEELKEQQTQQLSDMQAKQTEVQNLLSGLSGEVQQLMEQRDAEIMEAAAAEAAAAEEARRQAEEEARRAQAQQSGNSGGSSSSGESAYIPEKGSGQDYDAASGAQKRIVNSCYATPSPGRGYCAAWVSRVFQRAGFGYPGGNACVMYSRWCSYSKKADLQVGMIVAVSTHGHTSAGRIWGHVGIYIGDNRVMENIGAINTNSLDSWCSYYGDIVTPRWGWASGINLAARD